LNQFVFFVNFVFFVSLVRTTLDDCKTHDFNGDFSPSSQSSQRFLFSLKRPASSAVKPTKAI
jgi:hypothetical protein